MQDDSPSSPTVELDRLSKAFPGVQALSQVSLTLRGGRVHGLIGENGAGKSTLMNILCGLIRPDEGSIRLAGRPVVMSNPAEAIGHGIVMIHQELNLVDELSVAENIALGREPRFGPLVDHARMRRQAELWLDQLQCRINPSVLVGRLSIAQQQMVEIAKALSLNARVLIMDEPTAVITTQQRRVLFDQIRQLKQQGISIVFISHHLDEVLEMCDELTVLRDGRVVDQLSRSQLDQTSQTQLAGLMVGRDMAEHFPARQEHRPDVRLAVERLSVSGLVEDVGFQVHAGEIFGLAGLIGAGRTETAQAIAGLRRRDGGTIQIDGRTVSINRPRDAVAAGLAYVSEDRKSAGLHLDLSVTQNITLVTLKRYARLLINPSAERAAATRHVDRLGIRLAGVDQPARTLSGGIQQNVALAKWLDAAPKVLMLDEPTRGVDIGAKEEIYRLIGELARTGMACLMISSELNELLGMCHRIGVMRRGRLVVELDGPTATDQQIMRYAAGAVKEATA